MTEATPRPWALGPLADRVYGPDGTDIALMWADDLPFETDVANAALIVRAVNTYDERDALLREAADSLQYAARVLRGEGIGDPDEHMDIAARIRKALGETT